MLLIAVVLAVLAPLAAQLLYFACSRRREYLADASSALFTRFPAGLASALQKIGGQASAQAEVSKVIAPLYIVNPLQQGAGFTLFSTHPPTEERIRILRGMAGAGLAAYEAAYQQIRGAGQRCLGAGTVGNAEAVAIRTPTPEPQTREQAINRARVVGGLLEKMLPFVVIPCPCGLRIKLPPDFKRDAVACPRCGRAHPAPGAKAAASSAGAPGVPRPPPQTSR